MGEQTILVCDVCGKPAAETVTIRARGRNAVKDLCTTHVTELLKGTRTPRPGRRKAVASAAERSPAPKRRGRPPKTTAKRRGRPRKKA